MIKGFEQLVQMGLTAPVGIKLAICFAFFLPACYLINARNYFQDTAQHKQLMHLQLSFGQVFIALLTLLFWVFLRIALFGTK